MIMTTLVHDSDYVYASNEYADTTTHSNDDHMTCNEIWIEDSSYTYE